MKKIVIAIMFCAVLALPASAAPKRPAPKEERPAPVHRFEPRPRPYGLAGAIGGLIDDVLGLVKR